jgi:hypothetical protein
MAERIDELARVRAVAVAALSAARREHTRWCLHHMRGAACDCGADDCNEAIERAIAEIGATQEQADDEPDSYPGELWSDGPYKLDMRDGRGGWGPW